MFITHLLGKDLLGTYYIIGLINYVKDLLGTYYIIGLINYVRERIVNQTNKNPCPRELKL